MKVIIQWFPIRNQKRQSERPLCLHTWVMKIVQENVSSHCQGCIWITLRGV